VIHAVGPVYHDGRHGEPELLAGCYRASMALAAQHGITSIAFPAISCGIYGYPIPEAARVAVQTTAACLDTLPPLTTVIFACFGDDVLRAYEAALSAAS
jgi:O-acetyl-ADP-ribose deacetylase